MIQTAHLPLICRAKDIRLFTIPLLPYNYFRTSQSHIPHKNTTRRTLIALMTRGGGHRGRGRGGADLPREVQVSKKISWLLRHGAEKEGLILGDGGYVNVKDVLHSRSLRSLKVTLPELRDIVSSNDKQRFSLIPLPSFETAANSPSQSESQTDAQTTSNITLSEHNHQKPTFDTDDPSNFLVRANQGHSLKVPESTDSASTPELALLTPITPETLPPLCVHGTSHAAWRHILDSGGLKPMGRNHIHFAAGLPAGFTEISDAEDTELRHHPPDNDDATTSSSEATQKAQAGETPAKVVEPVISGMRTSSQVLIYIDLPLALSRGIPFFRSANNVILSPGDPETGVVGTEFFRKVEERTAGLGVLMRDGKMIKFDGSLSMSGGGQRGRTSKNLPHRGRKKDGGDE